MLWCFVFIVFFFKLSNSALMVGYSLGVDEQKNTILKRILSIFVEINARETYLVKYLVLIFERTEQTHLTVRFFLLFGW